jgi:hypothetical protein
MRVMKVIAIIALIAVAIGAYFYKQRKKNGVEIKPDVLDSELSFDDVIAFFKSKNLNKDAHTPFMANGDSAKLKAMLHQPFPQSKEGYVSLLFGIYNSKSDEIEDIKLVYAKSLSPKILEAFGNDSIVILN